MKKTIEQLMQDALFETLPPDEQARLDAWLAAHPEDAAKLQALSGTLDVLRLRERAEPEPAYWEGYYERLEARMGDGSPTHGFSLNLEGRTPWWERLLDVLRPRPTLAWQLGFAVVLLTVGIGLGRALFQPETGTTPLAQQATPAEGFQQAAAVQARAQRYMDRSKVLLLGLVNHDPATESTELLNLPRRQALARTLVDEAAVLKSDLTATEQQRLHDLIHDLEVILLQLANLEASADVPAIELVKQGVDQKAIFLKIDLEALRSSAAPASAPTPDPHSI